MAATLKLGDGKWATKEGSLLAYNDENNNFKPLPFDFTRASSATRVNKQGLIETVASGVPRIDFTDANGALLLEPQRTNIVLNSEPNSIEVVDSNITYESFSWANGFTNCVRYLDNSVNRLRRVATALASTEYTFSFYIIMDDLSEPNIGTSAITGDFYLYLGGGIVSSNFTSNNVGNNIWRVSGTRVSETSALTYNGIYKGTGNSSKGFRVVGWQIEQGSYATSYIPTQGSAVTVVKDVCNNAGNDQVFNNLEGVLYIEADILKTSGTGFVVSISNGLSLSESINIRQQSSGTLSFQLSSAGSNTFVNTTDWSEGINKIALRYNSNGINVYINGNSKGTNSAITYPNVNNLDLASRPDQVGQLIEKLKVKDVRVYNTSLTDSELQALTTI